MANHEGFSMADQSNQPKSLKDSSLHAFLKSELVHYQWARMMAGQGFVSYHESKQGFLEHLRTKVALPVLQKADKTLTIEAGCGPDFVFHDGPKKPPICQILLCASNPLMLIATVGIEFMDQCGVRYKEIRDQDYQKMLVLRDYNSFLVTLRFGHKSTAEWFLSLLTDRQKQEMFRENYVNALKYACNSGDVELAQMVRDIIMSLQRPVFRADNEPWLFVLESISVQGDLEMAQWVWPLVSKEDQQKLFQYYPEYEEFLCDAFHIACVNGHLAFAQWFLSQAGLVEENGDGYRVTNADQLRTLLTAPYHRNDSGIIGSISLLSIAQWFWSLLPQEVLYKDDYMIFRGYCALGNLAIAQDLWARASPEQQQSMLTVDNYGALRDRFDMMADYHYSQTNIKLHGGQCPLVRWLLSLLHDAQHNVFKVAYSIGYDYWFSLVDVPLLLDLWRGVRQDMQQEKKARVFQSALYYEVPQLAQLIWSDVSGEEKEAFLSDEYGRPFLMRAIRDGYPNLDWLLGISSPEQQQRCFNEISIMDIGSLEHCHILWGNMSKEQQQRLLRIHYFYLASAEKIAFFWQQASAEQKESFVRMSFPYGLESSIDRSQSRLAVAYGRGYKQVQWLWSAVTPVQQKLILEDSLCRLFLHFFPVSRKDYQDKHDWLWHQWQNHKQALMPKMKDFLVQILTKCKADPVLTEHRLNEVKSCDKDFGLSGFNMLLLDYLRFNAKNKQLLRSVLEGHELLCFNVALNIGSFPLAQAVWCAVDPSWHLPMLQQVMKEKPSKRLSLDLGEWTGAAFITLRAFIVARDGARILLEAVPQLNDQVFFWLLACEDSASIKHVLAHDDHQVFYQVWCHACMEYDLTWHNRLLAQYAALDLPVSIACLRRCIPHCDLGSCVEKRSPVLLAFVSMVKMLDASLKRDQESAEPEKGITKAASDDATSSNLVSQTSVFTPDPQGTQRSADGSPPAERRRLGAD